MPDSLTELGDYCFVNCPELKDITIPGSVSTIGNYALGFTLDTETKTTAKVDGFTIHTRGYRRCKLCQGKRHPL